MDYNLTERLLKNCVDCKEDWTLLEEVEIEIVKRNYSVKYCNFARIHRMVGVRSTVLHNSEK